MVPGPLWIQITPSNDRKPFGAAGRKPEKRRKHLCGSAACFYLKKKKNEEPALFCFQLLTCFDFFFLQIHIM